MKKIFFSVGKFSEHFHYLDQPGECSNWLVKKTEYSCLSEIAKNATNFVPIKSRLGTICINLKVQLSLKKCEN